MYSELRKKKKEMYRKFTKKENLHKRKPCIKKFSLKKKLFCDKNWCINVEKITET